MRSGDGVGDAGELEVQRAQGEVGVSGGGRDEGEEGVGGGVEFSGWVRQGERDWGAGST